MRTLDRPDPRETSARAADDGARLAAAEARSRLLRRGAAALIVVCALAVVIGPHLIDGTRISSVTAQAAKDAGGPPVVALSCPTDTARPLATPTTGVVLTGAMICDYPSGFGSAPSAFGRVPASQLPALVADLAQGTSGRPPRAGESAPGVAPGTLDAWAVIGLTAAGQQVELLDSSRAGVFSWAGSAPMRYWRPSADVLRLLTTDLNR